MGNSPVSSSSFQASPLVMPSSEQEETIRPLLEQDYAPVRTSTPRLPASPPMSMPPTLPRTSLPPTPPTPPPPPPSDVSAPEESPDEAFLRRTQEYIERHRDHLKLTRAWSIVVRVCTPKEMPHHEASMKWDAELFFACLSIRRDVPPGLHERLVVHELLELLTCESLELFLELIREIGDKLPERLIASFKRRYYAARNRHIEAILTEYFGEPRSDHLFLGEVEVPQASEVAVAPKEEAPMTLRPSKEEVATWLNTSFPGESEPLFGDETTFVPSASLPPLPGTLPVQDEASTRPRHEVSETTRRLASLAKRHLVPFFPGLLAGEASQVEEKDPTAPKTGSHEVVRAEREPGEAVAELSPRAVFANLPTVRLDVMMLPQMQEPITNPEPIIGRLGGTPEVGERLSSSSFVLFATPLPARSDPGQKSAWEQLMELQRLPGEEDKEQRAHHLGEMSPAS